MRLYDNYREKMEKSGHKKNYKWPTKQQCDDEDTMIIIIICINNNIVYDR